MCSLINLCLSIIISILLYSLTSPWVKISFISFHFNWNRVSISYFYNLILQRNLSFYSLSYFSIFFPCLYFLSPSLSIFILPPHRLFRPSPCLHLSLALFLSLSLSFSLSIISSVRISHSSIFSLSLFLSLSLSLSLSLFPPTSYLFVYSHFSSSL